MADTRIEWAHKVWNPITGCSPVSEGCQNCYARRMANRLRGRCGYPKENPFKVTLHPERLDEPLKWRKPRKVFVCSMSDLFHPDVPFDYITQVFDVMCSWRWPNKEAERIGDESLLEDPGHTYMVLTKRPERVQDWLQWLFEYWPGDSPVNANLSAEGHFGRHIWFGVTAENQQRADERIPILLQIPATVRFVSVEPMLGPVDLTNFIIGPNRLDWVICGSETGPNRREACIEWIGDLCDQCEHAGVPFFLKQMEVDGKIVKMPKLNGKVWDRMPEVE